MNYWRLSVCPGFGEWGYLKASCDCIIIDTPFYVFTWHAKTCKCGACNDYVCTCPKEDE